jgi:pimeloyl-ACP methyl ester carboxylesterase
MKEIAVGFGPDRRLLGIITSHNSIIPISNVPGVLLWNAGILHKVGPFRLFVDLARSLGELGFPVFRFDVSGKGDSESSKETLLEKERALKDIQMAMDLLSDKKGVKNFVLIGSCSGADEAFEVATVHPRVTGLILLDGFGYRTIGYYLHHYGLRIFKLGVWRSFLKNKIGAVVNAISSGGKGKFERGNIFIREFPPKKVNEDRLRLLVAREVNLFFVYSGGVEEYYSYRNQFRDMFKKLAFGGRITVEYFREAGHTYPGVASRIKLITGICDWMICHYRGTEGNALPAFGESGLSQTRTAESVL